MGPSIVVDGEKIEWLHYRRRSSKLQWGRRSSSTESRLAIAGQRLPGGRFNGAVDRRRRRAGEVRSRGPRRLDASMGPSIVVDGEDHWRAGHDVEATASMGPSIVVDGEADDAIGFEASAT